MYGQFGFTGETYSPQYIQSSIDSAYAAAGLPTNQGVLASDFNAVMGACFEGSSVTITNNYEVPDNAYVTIVIYNHAVVLQNIYPNF